MLGLVILYGSAVLALTRVTLAFSVILGLHSLMSGPPGQRVDSRQYLQMLLTIPWEPKNP